MLIDTHCHLDFPEFDNDRDEVIGRARSSGVGYIVNIGSSLASSKNSLKLSRQYDFIYAAVGIHPHEADTVNKKTLDDLSGLAEEDKVVAVGETGLDYYKGYSEAKNQRALFLSLLKLAGELKLPLVIHSRASQSDTLRILEEAKPEKAVVHCFSGDEHFLRGCLKLGFLVSFTCNITYKKAEDLRSLIKVIPLDKLMLETDAPFLPPQEFRGRRNEPSYIKYLAQEIARIKEISIEEVARITSDNAKGFFKIG